MKPSHASDREEAFWQFNPRNIPDSTDSLTMINNIIKKRPLLRRGEEIALAKLIESGDENARVRMIESNLRIVLRIAYRHVHKGLQIEDLIQEGIIGLIIAVDKYNWRRGTRFCTYAIPWIKQSILRAIDNKSDMIRIPSRAKRIHGRVNRELEIVFQDQNRVASYEEISDRIGYYDGLNVTAGMIERLKYIPSVDISLDQDTSDSVRSSLLDSIPDEALPNPEQVISEAELVSKISPFLSPKELRIVLLRIGYFDYRVYTRKEIAEMYGLSRTRVGQIEDTAYSKIRINEKLISLMN